MNSNYGIIHKDGGIWSYSEGPMGHTVDELGKALYLFQRALE